MTTEKKWTFGAVAAVVLVLVASWFLLVSPQLSEAKTLSEETQAQEAANATLQTDIAVLEEQYKELPVKQAQLKALKQRVPATDELPLYIQDLTSTADKSGVAMLSVTPLTAVPLAAPDPAVAVEGTTTSAPPNPLLGMNVDIVVTGGFFQIQEFVNDLETLERYTLVSGMTIASDDTAASSGDSPDLTATINARIYLSPEPVAETVVVAPETTP